MYRIQPGSRRKGGAELIHRLTQSKIEQIYESKSPEMEKEQSVLLFFGGQPLPKQILRVANITSYHES